MLNYIKTNDQAQKIPIRKEYLLLILATIAIWLVETGLTESPVFAATCIILTSLAALITSSATKTKHLNQKATIFGTALLLALLICYLKIGIVGARGIAAIIIYSIVMWCAINTNPERLKDSLYKLSILIYIISLACYSAHLLSATISINGLNFITKVDFFGKSTPTGFLLHPNGFADIVATSTYLIILFAKTIKKQHLLCAAISFLIIVDSSSRTSLLLFSIATFFLLFFYHKSNRTLIASISLIAIILTMLTGILDLSAIQHKSNQASIWSGRELLWTAYSSPILNEFSSFIFGLSSWQYTKISESLTHGLASLGPHNLYIYNAAVIGAPTLIIILAKIVSEVFFKKNSSRGKYLCLFIAIFLFVRGFIESESIFIPQTRTLLILLAIAIVMRDINEEKIQHNCRLSAQRQG